MNPEQLRALLRVMRDECVASAEVTTSECSLKVVFEPSMPPLPPGDTTTPGGWKGPQNLDKVEYSDPGPDRRLP